MRALLVSEYTSVQSLRIQEAPRPDVAADRVRVRVKAAGVGFVESLKIAGKYQTKDPLPFVPGTEFAGVVDEVGAEVSRLVPGNRVFGFASRGALAEEISVPASELSRIPDHLSFAQAAAVPVNYLTAMYGLKELAELRSGQNLLILGAAGGTGTAAIKIGKMLGRTSRPPPQALERLDCSAVLGGHFHGQSSDPRRLSISKSLFSIWVRV
jgi:NADPH:quinone reductase